MFNIREFYKKPVPVQALLEAKVKSVFEETFGVENSNLHIISHYYLLPLKIRKNLDSYFETILYGSPNPFYNLSNDIIFGVNIIKANPKLFSKNFISFGIASTKYNSLLQFKVDCSKKKEKNNIIKEMNLALLGYNTNKKQKNLTKINFSDVRRITEKQKKLIEAMYKNCNNIITLNLYSEKITLTNEFNLSIDIKYNERDEITIYGNGDVIDNFDHRNTLF